ncbi:MAG: hypothetical protein ACRCU1_18035, partial [Alsobacter sp.]
MTAATAAGHEVGCCVTAHAMYSRARVGSAATWARGHSPRTAAISAATKPRMIAITNKIVRPFCIGISKNSPNHPF